MALAFSKMHGAGNDFVLIDLRGGRAAPDAATVRAIANRHTGVLVGGTSPFGTKKAMPVHLEKTILDLPLIYINGGRRGFLVGLHPHDIVRTLHPKVVEVALKG